MKTEVLAKSKVIELFLTNLDVSDNRLAEIL